MLRGVAVALVLVEHMFLGFWLTAGSPNAVLGTGPLADSGPDRFYMPWAVWLIQHDVVLGNVGVALFFLISGFVIPMSLERYSIGRFAVARVFRLYPVWIATMALGAAAFLVHAAITGSGFPYDWTTWWQNAAMVQDWTGLAYINPIVWTLLIEVKFYAICAVLALFGLRRATPMLILLGVLVAVTLAAQPLMENRLEAGQVPVVRAIGVIAHSTPFLCFMFTGLCFYNLFRGRWGPMKCSAVAGACSGLFVWSTWGGIAPTIYQRQVLVSFTIALLLFIGCYALRARIPYGRTADFAADISYPLYALHYVVGGLLLVGLYRLYPVPLLDTVVVLAAMVVMSWVIHRWVEVPLNRAGKRVNVNRGMVAAARARMSLRSPSADPPMVGSGASGAGTSGLVPDAEAGEATPEVT